VARLVHRALHLGDGAGVRHYLLPYLAREVHGEWRLGANASGILVAGRDRLVAGAAGHAGHLQEWRPGDPEVAHHLPVHRRMVNGERVASGDMGAPLDAGREDRRVHRPAALAVAGREGPLCVPWPLATCSLSKYRRADDAITTPAVKAVAQLQRSRLSRSLDCAYVRPIAVGDRPAYAAFADNTSLRDHCIEMRKRLLKAPRAHAGRIRDRARGRPGVRGCAARAGVPTTAIQRAAMKMKFAGAAANQPLDPKQPPPGRPLPLQGGLPFDPNPDDGQTGRSWLGPAVLGGAALMTTIGIAIGVARSRRSVAYAM
jgi:hypothetical protein